MVDKLFEEKLLSHDDPALKKILVPLNPMLYEPEKVQLKTKHVKAKALKKHTRSMFQEEKTGWDFIERISQYSPS